MKRIFAILTAFILLVSAFGVTAFANTDLSDIQARQKEIQARLNQAQAQLSSVNSQINAEKKKQKNKG